MSKLVGRKAEIEELTSLYESGRAEFVAIYGRRRVGKTFLVKELFQDKMAFYHSGLSPYDKERRISMRDQLEAFYASLMNYGMEESHCPKTWMEAFRMLGELLDSRAGEGRQLLFIDELPWMDTARSKFLVAFEHFWNTWGAWRDRVMLIVCGSATSWMLDNLINNRGGLYDRLTCQMKLSPFTLGECKEFFESRNVVLSLFDMLECYMILGGIPYYLNYIQREKSLAQNVDSLFFAKNARLMSEFQRLFGSLFANPADYMQVVRLLGKRHTGFTRDEMVSSLGINSGGSFSRILEVLSESDFIASYVPFGKSQKEVRYRLTDSFCQFYLRFIDGQQTTDEAFWLHHQNMPLLNSWRGFAFEQVCFLHISEIKRALGVEGVASSQSAWIVRGGDDTQGTQVDMLIVRNDRVVNLCEIKFLSKEYEMNVDDEMTCRSRIATLQEHLSPKQAIHLTLITTMGLKRNAHSSIYQQTVTAPQLFG